VDAATFWATEWRDALARNGARAAADAARLDLAPLAITVDDEVWTLRRGDDTLEVGPGADAATPGVVLDADAFSDFVAEQRTALGLLIAGRVSGAPEATSAFCDWDAVVRSAIDGRGVYETGDVTLRALDGSPLDLDQRFHLGDRPEEAGHFLAEAGFLLLSDVFDRTRSTSSTPTWPAPSTPPSLPTASRGGRPPPPGSGTRAASSTSPTSPPPFATCSAIPATGPSVSCSARATSPATPSASTSPTPPPKGW